MDCSTAIYVVEVVMELIDGVMSRHSYAIVNLHVHGVRICQHSISRLLFTFPMDNLSATVFWRVLLFIALSQLGRHLNNPK